MQLKFWSTFNLLLCSSLLAASIVNTEVDKSLAEADKKLEDNVVNYLRKAATIVQEIKAQNETYDSNAIKNVKTANINKFQFSLPLDIKLSNEANTETSASNKTKPGAATFASVFENPDASCKVSIKVLDTFFPQLKKCYINTSLYLSTLENVCSKDCFNVTVSASQLIDKFCFEPSKDKIVADVKNDTLYLAKFDAYKKWSDKSLARLACLNEDKALDYKENSDNEGDIILEKFMNEKVKDTYKPSLEETKEKGEIKEPTKERCLDVLLKGSELLSSLNITNPKNLIPKDLQKKDELKKLICHPCVERIEEYYKTKHEKEASKQEKETKEGYSSKYEKSQEPKYDSSEKSMEVKSSLKSFPTVYFYNLDSKDMFFEIHNMLCEHNKMEKS